MSTATPPRLDLIDDMSEAELLKLLGPSDAETPHVKPSDNGPRLCWPRRA